MSDIADLRDTIIPKSDQLNADQLLGGPMTIRVTSVKRGSDEQKIIIGYENDNGRPYKPCLSMRKVIIFAWGENGEEWIGKMMTLYNKREVKWAGVEVGGIRISHMSDVPADIKLSLAVTRGKKEPIIIKRLDASGPLVAARANLEAAARLGMDALKAAWAALPVAHKLSIGGTEGCPANLKQIAAAVDGGAAKPNHQTEPQPSSPPVAISDPIPSDDIDESHF